MEGEKTRPQKRVYSEAMRGGRRARENASGPQGMTVNEQKLSYI